ncbi:ArsR/SmtB family transcription factor [Pseudonocardia spinosispora]|uniref:ArsR/SmtB family transcription factor n=1 Tax=Pseudonocardia spinosispora TaxID=103441 RepID=UPI00041BF85E|nr:helix-turn-helix transcriptional regulator [Pseudonocardia spinosispora]
MTSTPAVAVEADIAGVAAAIGDPSRTRVLLALAGGQALPASALAAEAGVAASTISGHLSKLLDAKLLTVERDGRHRFYRLATPDVARILEQLSLLAQPIPVSTLRRSTRAEALLRARLCYDHLAGRLGVAVMSALIDRGVLVDQGGTLPDTPSARTPYENGAGAEYLLSPVGAVLLTDLGVRVTGPRRAVRYCVDWAEGKPHLAGQLGGALADRLFDLGWIRRGTSRRVVHVTEEGTRGLHDTLGLKDP